MLEKTLDTVIINTLSVLVDKEHDDAQEKDDACNIENLTQNVVRRRGWVGGYTVFDHDPSIAQRHTRYRFFLSTVKLYSTELY